MTRPLIYKGQTKYYMNKKNYATLYTKKIYTFNNMYAILLLALGTGVQ